MNKSPMLQAKPDFRFKDRRPEHLRPVGRLRL